MAYNRRIVLGILSCFLAVIFGGVVLAEAPLIRADFKTLLAGAGLSGQKSIVVMDAITGQVLESHNGSKTLPPASVTKAATALYAMHNLGTEATFKTNLIATGPIRNGVLMGDLVLSGGGDPRLDTDALGALAKQLKAKGVRSITGRFLVYAGALPYVREVDNSQPDHVGYNPSIHGLNLNFNRVFFEWKQVNSGYKLSMQARGKNYSPVVRGIQIGTKARDLPVFTYRQANGQDIWTVATTALGRGGSRWLPVRRPADYAGEVFRTLAAMNGVKLPKQKVVEKPVGGTAIAQWRSDRVVDLIRSMIKYSTNMTAEVLGLSASVKRGKPVGSLRASGKEMTAWLSAQYGIRGAKFVDHSGLNDANRISAHEMTRLLVNAKWNGALRPVMKEITLRNAQWKSAPIAGAKVVVKTGTLNFASALAGYITCPNGRKLAFAIFTADMGKRAKIAKKDRERPAGAKAWARKSRVMQHQLVRHWIGAYGG